MSLAKHEMDATARDFKVLVADDSRIYRKLVEQTLSEKQYAVLFAKSGREAINLFSEHQPSLVITDWMMPDLSGIELCEHIRSHTRQSYTYLIILTGITEKNKLVKGLAAGADDYLTKPFHSDELLARVGVGRRIVELHRQLEAAKFDFDGSSLTVTASFGLAGFEGTQAPDFNRLVSQADAALYAAKRTGRNRIETAATQVL